MRAAAAALVSAMLAASVGPVDACAKKIGKSETTSANACSGDPPRCFTPVGSGCCDEPTTLAECGPKDAPVGTHLKWVCQGTMELASECRGVGAACVRDQSAGGAATTAPHAVVPLIVVDLDAAAPRDAGREAGREAGAGPKKR